jgi:hypothetical protein
VDVFRRRGHRVPVVHCCELCAVVAVDAVDGKQYFSALANDLVLEIQKSKTAYEKTLAAIANYYRDTPPLTKFTIPHFQVTAARLDLKVRRRAWLLRMVCNPAE